MGAQRRLRPVLFVALLAAAVSLFEVTLNGGFVGSDDAYIHLQYMDNLRSGGGFGLNPGVPSYGDTSPLWVVVATVVASGSPDLPTAIRMLSVAIFVTTLPLFYFALRRLGALQLTAFAGTLIYASDPWLLKWAGSAMESSLAAGMVLGYVLLATVPASPVVATAMGALLAAATLVRPEFALLAALALALALTQVWRGKAATRESVQRIALLPITYAAIMLPWSFYAWTTFGSPVPYTFLAKTGVTGTTVIAVGWYFARIIALSYWWAWGILAALLVSKWRLRLTSELLETNTNRGRLALTLWAWCLLVPAFYALSRLQTPSTRYLQITTPALLLVGLLGIQQLWSAWLKPRRVSYNAAIASITILIVAANAAANAVIVLPTSKDFSAGVLVPYQEVGAWIDTNTPDKSRIAVAIDVGAISFYSHREILDLGGLNNLDVIPYLPNIYDYVLAEQPDYLVVTGHPAKDPLADVASLTDVAAPVLSIPMNIGRRAELESATGENRPQERFTTVYKLSWP